MNHSFVYHAKNPVRARASNDQRIIRPRILDGRSMVQQQLRLEGLSEEGRQWAKHPELKPKPKPEGRGMANEQSQTPCRVPLNLSLRCFSRKSKNYSFSSRTGAFIATLWWEVIAGVPSIPIIVISLSPADAQLWLWNTAPALECFLPNKR